ncbi:hypothetical protein FRC08_009731 [Ceratobasidium sp. 394]|nr:hypothetical protein FRC08_009731 [Ceratobasidium sp. 394]
MSPTAARADSVCVAGTPGWMLSGSGQTPCQVAESLVRVCTSTAQVQHLATDVSCATLGTPSDSECCCSTVTYAVRMPRFLLANWSPAHVHDVIPQLVAGCWVCQTGRPPSQLATTYAVWLAGCNLIRNVLPPAVLSAQPPIDAPHWAFVRPSNPNATW